MLLDECVNFAVRGLHDAIHPLLVLASLNGSLAVLAAGVLNGSSISLGGVAGDHVCGVVVSRWILWFFGGMSVMVVRQSVRCGKKSGCSEIRVESCRNN